MSKTIFDYAKQYIPSFNKELLAAIPTEPKEAFGPIHELITKGGKRIRPTICMLCCEALGGKPEDTINYSIILELVHTLTLIHDDIEDFSDQRRGGTTLHETYGIPSAINFGDILFGLVSRRIGELEIPEARNLLGDAIIETGIGQAYDIHFRTIWNFDTNLYLNMVKQKTGTLLGAGCALGALVAKAAKGEEKKFFDYGLKLGAAFQIQDDILNLIGEAETYGKDIGGDILEGKKTLMVSYFLDNASEEDQTEFKNLWDNDRTNKEVIKSIIDLLKKYDTIEYAKGIAETLVKEAKEDITSLNLKDKEAESALVSFADYVINRTF